MLGRVVGAICGFGEAFRGPDAGAAGEGRVIVGCTFPRSLGEGGPLVRGTEAATGRACGGVLDSGSLGR